MDQTKWTQEEIDTLHEMVKEYVYAKRLGKTLKWGVFWLLGIPASTIIFADQIEKFLKIIRRMFYW